MLLNYKLFSKVYLAITFLVLVIITGIIGFMLFEHMSLFNAFYMTIITVSTVGYGETLSDSGRIFAVFLILFSFGTFAYAITAITTYMVSGEFKIYFKEYRVNKKIKELVGHIIICGYGRVGKQAAKQFDAYGMNFVVIDKNPEVVNGDLGKNHHFMSGDASDENVLIKAGIRRCSALLTTLPKDADNLIVVLTAREESPTIKIISRATQQTSVKKLKIGGADNVIMPADVGGAHMSSLVISPDVMEFLDHISVIGSAEINLEEIAFDELPQDMQHKTIGELNARHITGCNIVGFKTASGEYVINPSVETEIQPYSKLFVLGNGLQIEKLNNVLGVQPNIIKPKKGN